MATKTTPRSGVQPLLKSFDNDKPSPSPPKPPPPLPPPPAPKPNPLPPPPPPPLIFPPLREPHMDPPIENPDEHPKYGNDSDNQSEPDEEENPENTPPEFPDVLIPVAFFDVANEEQGYGNKLPVNEEDDSFYIDKLFQTNIKHEKINDDEESGSGCFDLNKPFDSEDQTSSNEKQSNSFDSYSSFCTEDDCSLDTMSASEKRLKLYDLIFHGLSGTDVKVQPVDIHRIISKYDDKTIAQIPENKLYLLAVACALELKGNSGNDSDEETESYSFTKIKEEEDDDVDALSNNDETDTRDFTFDSNDKTDEDLMSDLDILDMAEEEEKERKEDFYENDCDIDTNDKLTAFYETLLLSINDLHIKAHVLKAIVCSKQDAILSNQSDQEILEKIKLECISQYKEAV